MTEDSSLMLLANVALDNQPKSNLREKECQKRRDLRTKTLKVINLNGEDHADITDLKYMSISTLFKIFIEKFEDRKYFVYVCKYGQKFSCNTRFVDVKENRINRLEHLVQCHLLEHLTKTKTGSMIKLPKLFSTFEKPIPSINKPKSFIKSKPKYEEIEWKSEEKRIVDSIATGVKKKPNKSKCKSESQITKSVDDNTEHKQTDTSVQKLEFLPNPTERGVELNIQRVKFDHPYSNMNGTSSHVVPVSSIRGSVPFEYQTVDVNKLYYLNGESSSELNSLMIDETLNQPISIVIPGNEKLTTEQLPLVGCEAEVTTEKEYIEETDTDECSSKLAESYFSCTKCDIVLSTKHVLYLHMKNRHSDATIFKQSKGSFKSRTSGIELKTVKRKFEVVPEYRNADLFEVVKENKGDSCQKYVKRIDTSILKTALLKESNNKKPVVNISNIWNNISVQYV